MSKPLISIVVPVYNTGKYLHKCIGSLLEQDYPGFEIVVVDDGSTDAETARILDEITANQEKIKFLRKKNGGAASARNCGVRAASGEYVCFVDSDDYIDSNALSTLYSYIEREKVQIVFARLDYENPMSKQYPESMDIDGIMSKKDALHYCMLGYWHSACTVLYKKSLFDNITFI